MPEGAAPADFLPPLPAAEHLFRHGEQGGERVHVFKRAGVWLYRDDDLQPPLEGSLLLACWVGAVVPQLQDEAGGYQECAFLLPRSKKRCERLPEPQEESEMIWVYKKEVNISFNIILIY